MNSLYPIFLKTEQLPILIVGGGYVALEKLQFLFKSSPDAKVTLLAPEFRAETLEFIKGKEVKFIKEVYHKSYLDAYQLVIATTDNPMVNEQVYKDCREVKKLVNVADNPPLCDFYMGSIVTKGDLKIAISTNGKSPTIAKRLRQWLEQLLPDEIDELLDSLQQYRNHLKGDFESKVKALNKITKDLVS